MNKSLIALAALAVAPPVAEGISFTDRPFSFYASSPSWYTPPPGITVYQFPNASATLLGTGAVIQALQQPLLFHSSASLDGVEFFSSDRLVQPSGNNELGVGDVIYLPEVNDYLPHQLHLDFQLPEDQRSFNFGYTQPIPEPSTGFLAVVGVLLAGWKRIARWRKK